MNGVLVRILHFQNAHISTSHAPFSRSLPEVVHGQARTRLALMSQCLLLWGTSRIRGIAGSRVDRDGNCSHTDHSSFLRDAVGLDIKRQPHKEATA